MRCNVRALVAAQRGRRRNEVLLTREAGFLGRYVRDSLPR